MGVCGHIFGPVPENLLEGTDCTKFFVTNLNWCIFERTCECLKATEDTILWYEGRLYQVVVPIFEGVGHLDIFGVFGGNTLELVMFLGATDAPPIFSAEVPRVTHAGVFVNNYLAPNRPNRVSGIVKCSIEKFSCRFGPVKS